MQDLLAAVDAYCDAVPRRACRVEELGPLRLFVPAGPGHPWYARPSGPAVTVTADVVRRALDRQDELGLPRALEWVGGRPVGLEDAAREAGMAVHEHPLMVLRTEDLVSADQDGVRLVDASDPDLALAEAVARVGFAHAGTAVGGTGVEALDALVETDEQALAVLRARVAEGRPVVAAAFVEDVPVCRGGTTVVPPLAEVTGVATLPSHRRRGLAAAVTTCLVREASRRGADLVFLAADSDDVARLYGRLGFVRVGTSWIAGPGPAVA